MANHEKRAFVSILIPCRNEEKFVENCLKSVLSFKGLEIIDYEVLVIDGMSIDHTKEIIQTIITQFPASEINIIDNPKKIQSAALNIGINRAKGDFILRLDAHSVYPQDYLIKLLETSLHTNADNVGGIINTYPFDNSYSARLVQALTTHKFGVGNSGFRVGAKEGLVDTVPYGFFRKEIFKKVGFFDERLVRAQDYEFNCRIRASGGKVWINPAIQLQYFNQPDLYSFLKKTFIWEAPFNAYMWYLAPYTFNLRHSITALFTSGVLIGGCLSLLSKYVFIAYTFIIAIYFFLAIISSIQQAFRFRNIFHIFTLPFSFFLFHSLHGAGILFGSFMLLIKQSPVQRSKFAWGNTILMRYNKQVIDNFSSNKS